MIFESYYAPMSIGLIAVIMDGWWCGTEFGRSRSLFLLLLNDFQLIYATFNTCQRFWNNRFNLLVATVRATSGKRNRKQLEVFDQL